MAYNIIKGNIFAGGASPPDGYILTWSSADGYWVASPAPSGSFSAGGDLSGSSASQTVIAIQTRAVANIAPTDAYVLTWVNANNRWEPQPAPGGTPSGSAGGDLSSTYPNPVVSKIQTRDVNNIAPTDGYVLTWSQVDGYWRPYPVPGGAPSGSASGDLSGTYPNPTVAKIQTRNINNSAPDDGYILTWIQTDAYWAPRPNTFTGIAGGDLAGTYPNPSVIKLQNYNINSSAPSDGYVLTWSQADAYWVSRPTISATSDATTLVKGKVKLSGDLGGTADSPLVLKINSTSVPDSPTTNQILVATSSTSSVWSQIYDGYISNSANIAGSKITSATAGSFGVIQLTGDLSGTASAPIVAKIQQYSINNTPPTDGYVLTWSQADAYWVPRVATGGAPSGSASGDLSGTYPNPTVTKINTNPIALQTLTSSEDGYVLTWSDVDGYWLAQSPGAGSTPDATTLVKGKVKLANDLGGTADLPSVLKINGSSVPATPSANEVLVAVNGTTLTYAKIIDNNIDAAAAIAGSKITSASAGAFGVIQLTGDLGGFASAPIVTGLQSYDVNSVAPTDGYVLTWSNSDAYWVPRPTATNTPDATDSVKGKLKLTNDLGGTADLPLVTGLQSYDVNAAAPTDGYVLTWDQADGYWRPYPASGGTPSGSAGGDLSGTYPNPTVAKIKGNLVATQTLTSSEDGYVLTWSDIDGYWKANPSNGSNFTAGGDLSGNNSSQTVIKINGASVPVSGSLTTGNTLQVNGASSLTYSSLNLAGGSNFVTGILPTGNQASQNLVGDASGTTGAVSVDKIRGNTVASQSLGASQDGYVLTWSNSDGYWVGKNTSGGSPSGSAGGDLSGTYPNPNVNKIQGNLINNSSPIDGYFLTWSATDAYWAPKQYGDGYQHIDILSGISSNIGTGSNSFSRIGSIKIDTTQYRSSPTIVFEGIIEATSGQTAELRLYNVTDGAIVSGSTLSTTSTSSDYKSVSVSLASGTKIYEAQIRITNVSPSSGDGVICSNAKIRIR